MNKTQEFCLIGTKDVLTIPVQLVDGQNVISWETIEQVFPGVKCVKNGDDPVPRFIKYEPDAVLHVVLSSGPECVRIDSSLGAPSENSTAALSSVPTVGGTNARADCSSGPSDKHKLVEDLGVASALSETTIRDIGTFSSSADVSVLPASSPPTVKVSPKNVLSFRQVVRLASQKAQESDGQVNLQDLNAKMERMIRLQEAFDVKQAAFDAKQFAFDAKQVEFSQLQSYSNAQQDEMKQLQLHDRDRQEAMKQLTLDHHAEIMRLALDHHAEIKQLQVQALGQLAVLQERVKAVLTQTYELLEYPIPRLFVVLPEDPSKWDAINPFTNNFRLYFLCECGEHTQSSNADSKIPHHIHLAMHEGYLIKRPTEFFQQYGAYALTILKMLKFGITVAGVAIPALPLLINTESMGKVATSLKHWQESIKRGVDQAISHIDDALTYDGGAAEQMENKEALEGADLRKLDTFLMHKDGDKVLGNLNRVVTDEGHVKWVCIDHYRENYQESTSKDFQRMLDSVGGSFDKTFGRMKVTLRSTVLAKLFFSALGKARSVYELGVTFDWACTSGDLDALESALKTSRVATLSLDIRQIRTSKLQSTSAQYGALLRIISLPNMRLVHVVLSKDVVKLLSMQSKMPYSHCNLSIEVASASVQGKDVVDLAEALKTNSTLTTLSLRDNSIGDEGTKALAETLRTYATLTTLNLNNNSIGEGGAKALAEALKVNSTLTTLNLNNNPTGEDGAKALAEALKVNSTLTTLNLNKNSIGDEGAKVLAEALVPNSTLVTLYLRGNSIWLKGLLAFLELLKTKSALTSLDLMANKMGSEIAAAMAEAFNINSGLSTLGLNLNSWPIGKDGAKALAQTLHGNSIVTTLTLRSCSIEEDGVKALAKALKTNSTLITLNLDNNSIGRDGAKALSEALNTNSDLSSLSLRDTSLMDYGAKTLAEALKTNSTLAILDLCRNSIGDIAVKALAEALKTNSTLTTLNLRDNAVGEEGAKALAEALMTNSTLTTLILFENSIGEEGANALAWALMKNSTLTTLDMCGNSIGDVGATTLAEALKINFTLTTLDLSFNLIAEYGAKALDKALEINSTLAILDLCGNSIGNKGAKALAWALKTNSTLTTLNLKQNAIGEDGAKALAEALKTNSTLTTLNMYNNPMREGGVNALVEACQTNPSLSIRW
ncbi:hypothetical protein BGZ70_007073 [Mortierella alpina]|uniref:RNI-like protein n=1 Tax=Mortierella alpina TaxID=64518 RepID=A0A9P6M3C2_MORAP|nr:hypothetical protein BGZ70_007073 [Mortierella alpina]